MHKVTIFGLTPDEAVKLKNQLLEDGLIMHQDFEWEYRPITWNHFTLDPWDRFTLDPAPERQAVCTFDQGSLASFYQLKWS